MNTDLDERLIPDGEYVFAKNVQVLSSSGTDAGVVENIKSTALTYTLDNYSHPIFLATLPDEKNMVFYIWVTSDNKDAVLEYNTNVDTVSIIMEYDKPNSLLNFDKYHLINAVKIINDDTTKDLLIWTDDYNEIKQVNIEDAKINHLNYTEDDVFLIKRPPKYPLKTIPTYTSSQLENYIKDKFISFAYRYKYKNGQYSALSPFTYYQFSPSRFKLDYISMENLGMVNMFNAVKIYFNTGNSSITDIELVYKLSNSNNVYIIDTFNKKRLGYSDNTEESFLFSSGKRKSVLPEKELFRTYDNVPRRAKTISVIGNRLIFGNYVEGYDLKDKFDRKILPDFNIGFDNISLLDSSVNSILSISDVTNDTISIDFSSISLTKDLRLSFKFSLVEYDNTGMFDDLFDFILPESYATVDELANDQDFIAFVNSVMTDKFKTNFVNTPPSGATVQSVTPFSIQSVIGSTLNIKAPIVNYDNGDIRKWVFENTSIVSYRHYFSSGSIKTNRNYEAVIVYYDKFGRASTGITSKYNTAYLPQKYSSYQNKMMLNINHPAPNWATHYKIGVRQNKGEYFTVYTNLIYEDPDNKLYRWIKLEGENKNKVKEGDTLIVKADFDGIKEEIIRVKVLEITSKLSDFIDNNDIKEEGGLYMKIRPVGFNANAGESTFMNFHRSSHYRYPIRNYTEPAFGTYDANGNFTPYPVKAGSRVRIRVNFKLRGKDGYSASYDKTFRASDSYNSVKEWFDAEVRSLGKFGRDFTWDGVTPIWNVYKGINVNICGGHGLADSNNRFSGWGFGKYCDEYTSIASESHEHFFIVPHRAGYYEANFSNVGDRNVSTDIDFDVFFSSGELIFETEPDDNDSNIFFETEETFDIIDGLHQGNVQNQAGFKPAVLRLGFYNCYTQGNGAETYRYLDSFNGSYLNIDTRPIGISDDEFREIRRESDLTYSSVYNESTNINGLNEFNLSTVNYKDDIEKKYGSIQLIHPRDNDLLVFQEDKVSKVLFGKDLLMNADGTYNITAIPSILGRQLPYAGEYGISNNPESFALNGNRIYFCDAKRGKVLRLSTDGISEITYGMQKFFNEAFKSNINGKKFGVYDPHSEQYILNVKPSLAITNLYVNCQTPTTHITNKEGIIDISIDFGMFTDNVSNNKITLNSDVSGRTVVLEYDSVVEEYTTVANQDLIISFNKELPYPENVKLKIYNVRYDNNFYLDVTCSPQTYKVVNVIVGRDDTDDGTFISEYRWKKGDYISDFVTREDTLVNNLIFEELDGYEGLNSHPSSLSNIQIRTVKYFDDQGGTISKYRLGYLITDTYYTESQIQDVLDNATFLPTSIDKDFIKEVVNGEFLFAREDKQYVYLIWDYSGVISSEIIHTYNVLCASQEVTISGVSGTVQVIIDFSLFVENSASKKFYITSNVTGRNFSFELQGNIQNFTTVENQGLYVSDIKYNSDPTTGIITINNVEETDEFIIQPYCVDFEVFDHSL